VTEMLEAAAATVLVNSFMSSAASAGVAAVVSRILSGRWSLQRMADALAAGVAVVSCGGPSLHGWHCLALGVAAGLLYLGLRNVLLRLTFPDNGHLTGIVTGGTLGLLLTPALLFSAHNSWPRRLGWHAVGCMALAAWGFVLTAAALLTLHTLKLIMLPQEDLSEEGLDAVYTRERVDPGRSASGQCCNRHSCRSHKGKLSSAVFPGLPPPITDDTRPRRVSVVQLETPKVLAPPPNIVVNSLKSPPRYSSRSGIDASDFSPPVDAPVRLLSSTTMLPTDAPPPPMTTFNAAATAPTALIPKAPPLPPPPTSSVGNGKAPISRRQHQQEHLAPPGGGRPVAVTRNNIHAGLNTLKPLPQDAKRRESLSVRRKVTPLINSSNPINSSNQISSSNKINSSTQMKSTDSNNNKSKGY